MPSKCTWRGFVYNKTFRAVSINSVCEKYNKTFSAVFINSVCEKCYLYNETSLGAFFRLHDYFSFSRNLIHGDYYKGWHFADKSVKSLTNGQWNKQFDLWPEDTGFDPWGEHQWRLWLVLWSYFELKIDVNLFLLGCLGKRFTASSVASV